MSSLRAHVCLDHGLLGALPYYVGSRYSLNELLTKFAQVQTLHLHAYFYFLIQVQWHPYEESTGIPVFP